MADRYNDRNQSRRSQNRNRGSYNTNQGTTGDVTSNRGRYSGYDRGGNNPDWDSGTDNRGYEQGRYDTSGSDYDTDYLYNYQEYGPGYTYEEWWLVPGPYTGQGPQGYERPDDRIYEDVCDRLLQNGQVDATNMTVDVKNGEVTLKGDVPDRNQKRLAEDIADSVPGVQDIHNQLHVAKPGQQGRRQFQGSQQGQQFQQGQSVHQNMRVFGLDGNDVGTVKQVRTNDFLVERSMARDIFVPFSAIKSTSGNSVTLNVKAGDVDNQGWMTPESTGQRQTQFQR